MATNLATKSNNSLPYNNNLTMRHQPDESMTSVEEAKSNTGETAHATSPTPLATATGAHPTTHLDSAKQHMQNNASLMMPPPPLPVHNYGSAAHPQWNVRSNTANGAAPPLSSHSHAARPPLPPPHYHLSMHAPRPAHPYEASGSGRAMRGDGFLLDGAEDEDSGDPLDLSNSSDTDALPLPLQLQMQLQRSATTGPNELESELYGGAGSSMPLLGEPISLNERPRSAGPSFTGGPSLVMSRTSTGESSVAVLVCPACGEQPTGADAESSFHAHVSRCFAQHASPARGKASPNSDSGGPIRKTTRGRAASAAAATGSAAEMASALANAAGPQTPETHGYHPYNAAGSSSTLSSTLRQLRRTVDQMDLHQRLSMMEAFNRLSRQAQVEHAASSTPRSKQKLRSATNSPSPKHKPIEDKATSNILSLLYSPRITAPHPSPAAFQNLQIGVPSPLTIGLSSHHLQVNPRAPSATPADADTPMQPSILTSPMDTLELGATHGDTVPLSKPFLFASMSPDPVTSPVSFDDAAPANSIMITDADAEGSSLALNGNFVQGLSSGNSSPASSSAQTSPSAPTDGSGRSERLSYPDMRQQHARASVAPLPATIDLPKETRGYTQQRKDTHHDVVEARA